METGPSSRSTATGHPERVAAFWDGFKRNTGWFLRWLGDWETHGTENMPESGPVIVVSNHVSYSDPLLTGWALRRPGAFMAKAELFKYPVVRWFCVNAGAFPILRGVGDLGAIETAGLILRDGWPLIVYPEGTRNDTGKWGAIRLRSGAARIALTYRVPILPVANIGTHRILPTGAWWPRRVHAEARIGKPLMPADYLPPEDWPIEEQLRYVNDKIFWAVAELLPDDMKVLPTDAPRP
ncbi:MAG: 1-acyl-sn-glycerol-3-phosphate acyltransferase [Candidatus Sericytochromatia bacterium]|nr:1-acyl-sn-glycerol-3-phosphate acyltransferase [Candidatus Sericytochromatia bacterium]